MRLDRKLDAWQAAGLLGPDEAAGIRAYEAARASGAGTWVVFALGAAAGLAVVVGLVAIAAANWDEVPDWLKLAGVGGLLLGSLILAWRASAWRTTWPYDLALLAHTLLVPAMIGVTAQVYHLSGPPWRTLLVCAVLALPAAAMATRSLVTDVFLGYTVAAVFVAAGDVDWLEAWLGRGFGWGYLAVTLGALALAAERVTCERRAAQAPALARWGVGLLAVAVVVAAESWGRSWFSSEPWPAGPFALALSVGGAVAAWRLYPWRDRPAAVTAAVLGAAFLAGVPGVHWGVDETAARFAGLGLFCAFCVALAMAAAQAGSRRWVTAATLAIAVRVVVFYLELSGSLMSTGVGLVVTGLVIGGVAFAWWRVTRAIRAALPSRAAP